MITRGLVCGFIISDWSLFPWLEAELGRVRGKSLPRNVDLVSRSLGCLTTPPLLGAPVLVRELAGVVIATLGGGGEEGGGGASVEDAGAGVTCFEFLSSTEETVGVACNVDEILESCLMATGWTLS